MSVPAIDPVPPVPPRRRVALTETKAAYKTTELIAYVATVVAVLISAAVTDFYGARQAWLYVTILTAAYLISRGLAKSGSLEPYERDDGPRGRPVVDRPRVP